MSKRNIVITIMAMLMFLLALNVSYSAQSATGTTANLSTWDNTSQIGEIDDNIEFYANYYNGSGLLSGATCNITFSGSTQTMSESTNYEYSRNFSTYGNYSYDINCTLAGFDSLNITDWVYINPEITTNLTLWDSSINKTEYDNTPVTFYANYTNTTAAANQFVSGAACNISFSDGSAIMNQGVSAYNYTRNFTTLGNKTYTVNCTAPSLPSAQNSSWINIIETPLDAPTLFWNTATTQVNQQTLNLSGYINQANLLIMASVSDNTSTLIYNLNTTSGELSALIGTFTVINTVSQGAASLVINGSEIDFVTTNHFIEFSNHNNTDFVRYDINSTTIRDPTSKTITLNGSLISDVPAGTIARVYDKRLPSGYFTLELTFYPNITNYVRVWGVSSYGTPGAVSNFSVYYNTTPVDITLADSLIDQGLTTDIETLFFDWANASGVAYYEISIGTAQYPNAGYGSVVSWTRSNTSNFTGTYDLDIDTVYYAAVRAVNGSIVSNVIVSNGIIYLDTSPPVCLGNCIVDEGDWTNDGTISATWNFTENESEISYYTYEVGTQACYEINSSNVAGPTQTIYPYANNIIIGSPVNNQTYYFNVWAKNTEAYRTSTSDCYSSNGVRFDNETPSSGYISYPSGRFSAPQIIIDYSPGADLYSGLARNELWQRTATINTVDASCNAFISPTLVTNLSLSNDTETINLQNGYCYNFEIVVYDLAGNQVTYRAGATTYNYSLDSTIPTAPIISDAGNNGGYSTTSRTLTFSWSGAQDNQSGIKGYSYRLYKGHENNGSYISTIYDWSYTTDSTITIPNLGLEDSQVYFLEVYAVNHFDMKSGNATSDGLLFLDSTPPSQLTVLNVHNDVTSPYFILTNESSINFTVVGEPFESCQVSLFDIDYLVINNSKVLLEFTTNGTSYGNFSIGTGNLSQGENTVYIACRDLNGNEQTTVFNQTTEILFTIDTQGPTINVVHPANGTSETGVFEMQIDVTDYYGVKSADYKIVNASDVNDVWYSGVLLSGSNYRNLDFNPVGITTADFNIIINATDMNNQTSSLLTTFEIDNTIPDADIYNSKHYYSVDFSMNFTFELFTNYTITIEQDNGSLKYFELNTSSVQRTLVNDSVTVPVYTDWTNWPETNYTVNAVAKNLFGNVTQDTDWFVIDRTQPYYQNNIKIPSTVYSDDDITIMINVSDDNLEDVWLEANFTGNMTNYTVSSLGDVYSYIINAENTSTNEIIRYRWHANDTAQNIISTTWQSFTVQNRVPYFTKPDIFDNNTEILNKQDFIWKLEAFDSDDDNLTYNVLGSGPNITASIFSVINQDGKNKSYVKISPDNTYNGSSWIQFNVTDQYGASNTSINLTLNITDSIGPFTFNINTTENMTIWFYENISLPDLGNYIIRFNNAVTSIDTAIPIIYNSSIVDVMFYLDYDETSIILQDINVSSGQEINLSYYRYNTSLINESLFQGGNYYVYDSFIFEIDNSTYNRSYTALWEYNYTPYFISDYIASNFLYIFKLDINMTNLTINYSTAISASGLTVNTSSGIIWGTFTDFSLFVLAHLKPTTEVCGNGIDEDQDGSDLACPPSPPSGGSGSSSGGSSSSSSSSSGGYVSVDRCLNGRIDTGEHGPDCGGTCSGFWYDNSCHLISESSSSCSDGVENGDEQGVDCGGSCSTQCASTEEPGFIGTCFDSIKNQNEVGTDCGGVCNSCATCYDKVQNGNESGLDCGGSCEEGCLPSFLSILQPYVQYKNYAFYGLAGLLVLVTAFGFVLSRKHPEHDYKMPKSPADEIIPVKAPEIIKIGPQPQPQPMPQVQAQPAVQAVHDVAKQRKYQSDFDNLVDFVNKEQSKGVLNNDIKDKLIGKAWPEEMIEMAFERTECTRKLGELDRFIKKSKDKGHSDNAIRETLLKADWADHFIDMVLHEVHELHDDFEKVRSYAKSLMQKGYTKDDIIKTLTDVGWNKIDVEPYIE